MYIYFHVEPFFSNIPMNWKDLFYFTQPERRGISLLLVLIVLILASPAIYSALRRPRVYDSTAFEQDVLRYQLLLAEYHAARAYTREQARTSFSAAPIQLKPIPFDPNTTSAEQWQQMGMPERIARNIGNYLRAGGQFRYREDLMRIYAINQDLYNQLEPFIQLPPRPQREIRSPQSSRYADSTRSFARNQGSERPSYVALVVDINKADTTELQSIRGLGPVFSRRIVSYRDLLGGYYAIDQLLEVYGMDTTRFNHIKNQISLSDEPVKKINLNTADFATLLRHPYLNRNQVNSILQIRNQHGPYKSIEQIKSSKLISDSLFAKISPYLSVDEE